MSRELERRLIGRILQDGSARHAQTLGVGSDYFTDVKSALAWRTIIDHSAKPGSIGNVPSARKLIKKVPGLEIPEVVEESVDEIVSELKDEYLSRTLRTTIIDLDELLRSYGPEAALEHLNAIARTLNKGTMPDSSRLDLADAIPRFREHYETINRGGGLLGMPYPWDPLNEGTGGMSGGTFSMIYGPSKGGKTWMGLEVGAICPFERGNARCLVVSNEMPVDQIYRRILARLCRMDYGSVVRATLDEEQRGRMFEELNSLQYEQMEAAKSTIESSNYRNIRCVKPSARFGGGVNAIRAEIDAFQPDILFIDGVYLMSDDRTKSRDVSWKTITNITQDVKGLASEYNIPVIGTTQSNREGAKRKAGEDMGSYNDVGFGLSAIQDADAVIRVQKIPTREGEKILITLPAMRESKIESFTVNFVPVVDFSLHQVNLTQDQVEHLQSLDAPQKIDKREDQPRKFRTREPEGELWTSEN
jgi:replicative DNA helicase